MTDPKRLSRDGRLRSSWQVLAVYIGASWAVLQVVDVLKDNMGLPDWVFPFSVVLLLIGLPIMLATAMIQGRPAAPAFEAADSTPARATSQTDSDLSPRRFFTWRNALIGGAAAFVLLAAVTTGFMFMRTRGIGPVGSLVAKGVLDERSRIVLAEFDAADAVLARTVTESFRVDLTQSPVVHLVEPDTIADALARMGLEPNTELTEATARELAMRGGFPAVVGGDVAPLGGGYVLTARLVSSDDGAILASARASARDQDALLEAIDEASSKLREQIGESYTSLRETPSLAHVSTGSLDALKKYTEAIDARFRGENTEAAIQLLEEAVKIDSTFALAWRDISTITRNIGGSWDVSIRATEKAFQYRERLSERERYLVEANYHQEITEDHSEAIQAYESMLRLDPGDAQALNNIGFNYYELVDFENALVWYRRAHEAAPDVSLHLANVAITEANLGNLEAAESSYAVLDSFPPNPGWDMWRSAFRWLVGDEDGAREGYFEMQESYPSRLGALARSEEGLASLELVHGRVAAARQHLEAAVDLHLTRDASEDALDRLLDMADWELRLLGDTTAALAELDLALERVDPESIPPLDRPWGNIGRILLGSGELERGRGSLERGWDEVPDRIKPTREKYRAGDRASIAGAEGRPLDALAEIRSLPPWACIPCRARVEGNLFDEAGQADSAVVYYERYVETPFNFRLFPDSNWLGPTLERLGQLSDELGDPEKAAVYYAQFVDLWGNADPELQPRVAAARARLEQIVRERG